MASPAPTANKLYPSSTAATPPNVLEKTMQNQRYTLIEFNGMPEEEVNQ
jgi:hypothetical protein